MAGFEGIVWAPGQLGWSLVERKARMLPHDAGTYAVSKSIHYGLFLAFEGIRFFVRPAGERLEVVFVNLGHNLRRFREAIAFNLGADQQAGVPDESELAELFLGYLGHPDLHGFLAQMAAQGAQGYLRPFTVDDAQSIGVTAPTNPSIRVVAARYDRYLGEPFHGVSTPWLVRAVRGNGTGRLKLGTNYLMSVKAIQAAKELRPDAGTALFLDDRTHVPVEERVVTEWDTSCAMVALRDGTVVRIPDSPLILPSVTVKGLTAVLRQHGVSVEERDVTFGELCERAGRGEVVTVCSIGTAGILNRCSTLSLYDDERRLRAMVQADTDHPLYAALGRARQVYWDIYRGLAPAPEGMEVTTYVV